MMLNIAKAAMGLDMAMAMVMVTTGRMKRKEKSGLRLTAFELYVLIIT